MWSLPHRPALVWATDAILVALIIVFPFIMGGREAWGHRILITLSSALGFVWCLHRARTGGRWHLLSLEPLLIAGLLLVWFQTLSLTPSMLGKLSGEYERLLPSWALTQGTSDGEAAASGWSSASLYPVETRHAFLMLVSYGIIAIVVAQRLNSEEDCHQLLKLIGVSGLLMAGFAVIQLVTSNDRFFWFYRQPHTGTREVLKGAFTNRNHFAQFLSLSIGPLIWWMLIDRSPAESGDTSRRYSPASAHGNHSTFGRIVNPKMLLLVCATGGILLSIMLSLSRGGMISAGLACAVCLGGLWRSGRVKSSLAAAILALGVIAMGGLAVFGHDSVEERIGQLASGDADQIDRLNARRSIWKADLAVIKAFPIVGTGVGSHRFVYPLFMEDLSDFIGVSFSHAESSYIHLALETGLPGLGLLILALTFSLGRIGWQMVRGNNSAQVAALAAVLASLVGGTVHAAVDFIWYAPAIVVSTIMLGVAGLRLCSGFNAEQGIKMPRIGWFTLGAVCLLILCLTQPDLTRRVAGERLWYQYLIADFDAAAQSDTVLSTDSDLDDLERAISSTPSMTSAPASAMSTDVAEYQNASVSENLNTRVRSLSDRIDLLMASLKANPNQAEANQQLASKCLDLFDLLQTQSENRLPLQQIRDVVLTSRFETTTEMYGFLKKAFGKTIRLTLLSDEYCRRSLRLCPLTDRSYETLISTSFLRDPADRHHDEMIDQTLLVGRNSPRTHHSVGLSLLMEGRQLEAMRQLATAFHSQAGMRLSICRELGKTNPVDVVLTQFNPSADELDEVLMAFLEYHRPSDIRKLTWMIAEKVRQPEEKSGDPSATEAGRERHLELLMDAYRAAYDLRLHDRCEELLLLAIDCDPAAEPPRRALGLLLLELKNYEAAEQHFAWCYEQLPGDTKLEELRRECRRLAINQSRQVIPASFRP